jgi:hypothetical protein
MSESEFAEGGFVDLEPALVLPGNEEFIVRRFPERALSVIAKPHPLSDELVMAEYPVGTTLAEIVGPGAKHCRIEIAGEVVPSEWWPRIRPKPSTAVLITRIPQSALGGVKGILRLVAFAALAVVTYGVATGVIFGLEGLAAVGAAAGIGIAGSLLISALIPPQTPATPGSSSVTQLQSITGTQNQATPWNVIPCVIGTMRMFPTLAALPFSEINGNDQYVRFLFDFGYGNPSISDLKIGDDDLANFTDVELQIGTPRNLIPDSDGTSLTWTGDAGLVFNATAGAVAGGAWRYTGTGAASTSRARTSQLIVVTPGKTCTLSAYIDASHVTSIAGGGNPFFGVFNPAITTLYASVAQPLGSNGRLNVSFVVPSGVTQVVVVLSTNNCTVASGQLLVFSDAQLEFGALTDYQSSGVSLFTDDITETAAGDVLNTDGNTATRTSAALADELAVDFVFPNGLFGFDSKGNAINVTCDIRVEVSKSGTGAWSSVPSLPGGTSGVGLTISNTAATVVTDIFRVTSSARQTLRVGFRWKCNSGFGRNQYDIRVTRVTTNWGTADVNSRSGNLTWAIVRTIRYTLPSTTNTEKASLRIKATDQLNGSINQFNGIAAQPIPVWNGSAWVLSTTNNDIPAYVYRWVLTSCPANPRLIDPSRVDDAALIAWGAECIAKEFTFDTVQDQPTTVFELLKDICAAGRASFTVRDGKYSVVRDVAQTVPVQHFTPRNSWGFQGQRNFIDQVQALRVQYVNPEANYQNDEIIVYDDGFSADGAGGTTIATKFETFQIRGCTNANGAWRLGRYHLAVARLRPNLYTWNADVEHIVCQRGDLVKFASDVISVGTAWGRIKSVTVDGSHNVTAVVVDEPLLIAASTTYAIRIRTQDAGTHVTNVTVAVGDGITAVTLVTPIPPVGITPSVNTGDLFLFGITGQESADMIITIIEPGADLSAKITAVDAAPAVLTADSGTVPTLVSSITGLAWNDVPPPPDLIIITSDEGTSPPDDGGIRDPGITIGVGKGPSRPIRPSPVLPRR